MGDVHCGLRAYAKMTECEKAFKELRKLFYEYYYTTRGTQTHYLYGKCSMGRQKLREEEKIEKLINKIEKENKLLRECVEFYEDAWPDLNIGNAARQCLETISEEK